MSGQRNPAQKTIDAALGGVCRSLGGWRINEVSDRPEIEIQRQTAFGDDGQLK